MKWDKLFQFLYRKKLTLSSQSQSELSGWKKEKKDKNDFYLCIIKYVSENSFIDQSKQRKELRPLWSNLWNIYPCKMLLVEINDVYQCYTCYIKTKWIPILD